MENKYSIYRNIRYQRTFRTIGKMSWWRIVLGIILIILVLLISGVVSQQFAAREQFHIADKLMISPEWMEKYKPETKAFIEAGVHYQDGNVEQALSAFEDIEGFEAADVMESRCFLKISAEALEAENYDAAYDNLLKVNFSFLNEETEEYISICNDLISYYEGFAAEQSAEQLAELNKLIEMHSNA